MKKILLDTSIIVDFIRREDKANTELVKSIKEGYQLSCSIITHSELYAGKSIWEKPEAREELITILSGIEILPISETISEQAGQLKATTQTNLFDALIAATALKRKLTVLTLNSKDFKKITGLKVKSSI